MKKVLVNNNLIAYERRGNGTPLVLIHGFPLDHTSWNEIAPLLEDKFDHNHTCKVYMPTI